MLSRVLTSSCFDVVSQLVEEVLSLSVQVVGGWFTFCAKPEVLTLSDLRVSPKASEELSDPASSDLQSYEAFSAFQVSDASALRNTTGFQVQGAWPAHKTECIS